MKVGKKLKELRHLLTLTQDDMAQGIMSRSFYSRVENGISSPGVNEMIALLKMHDVSVVNFLEDEDQVNLREKYQDQVILAYFKRDLNKLKQLRDVSELNNRRDKFAIKMLIAKLEGKETEFTSVLRRKMKHAFFEMKDLNKNILWLLLVYMNLYEFDELGSLMDVIFSRYEKSKNLDRRTLQLMASICVSYLKRCSQQDENDFEFMQAERVLAEVPNIADVFLQKLIGQYFIFKRREQDEWAEFVKELIAECGYENYLEM